MTLTSKLNALLLSLLVLSCAHDILHVYSVERNPWGMRRSRVHEDQPTTMELQQRHFKVGRGRGVVNEVTGVSQPSTSC